MDMKATVSAGHTPGPWKLEFNGYYWTVEEVNPPDGGYRGTIASVPNYDESDSSPRIEPHEALKNAILMAAAPDLLAALESALVIVDRFRIASNGDGDLTAYVMRRAIVAAKGEV